MSVLIITALDTSKNDRLIDTKMKWITDGIESAGKEYRCIDINELALKRCLRENCTDREYDRDAIYGCAKSNECIYNYNMSATSAAYDELVKAEAIIYIVDTGHRTLNIFLEEIGKKEKEYAKRKQEGTGKRPYYQRSRLRDKKYLAIISSGQARRFSARSYVEMIIDYNRRYLSMEAADFFLVDRDNELYMEQVIPLAVTTFTNVIFHNDRVAWLLDRYGLSL